MYFNFNRWSCSQWTKVLLLGLTDMFFPFVITGNMHIKLRKSDVMASNCNLDICLLYISNWTHLRDDIARGGGRFFIWLADTPKLVPPLSWSRHQKCARGKEVLYYQLLFVPRSGATRDPGHSTKNVQEVSPLPVYMNF